VQGIIGNPPDNANKEALCRAAGDASGSVASGSWEE